MGDIGEAGKIVAANIERLRLERGLSVRVLCVRLGDLGRPIWPSMVHATCKGERHVNADDLVAFARALGVDPAALLEPPEALTVRGHPAVRAARLVVAQADALVRVAGNPEAVAPASGYLDRAIRRLRLEVEEVVNPSQPSGSDQSLNTRTLR